MSLGWDANNATVACGMISQYNSKPEELYPIRNLMNIVTKRITMRGFIVMDANMGQIGRAHV